MVAGAIAGSDLLGCKNPHAKPGYTVRDPQAASEAKPIYKELSCQHPNNEKEYELCQQWRAAQAAEEQACVSRLQFWVGTVISAFGLAGLFGTLIYTADAAKAAAKSADAANDTLVASQRAWIRRDRIAFDAPLMYRDDGIVHSAVTLEFTNVGNAPALHVNEHVWLMLGEKGGSPPYDRARENFRKVRSHPVSGGFTLFPGQTYPRKNDLLVRQAVHLQKPPDLEIADMTIYVAVCINYAFASDRSRNHQTCCVFEVSLPIGLAREQRQVSEGLLRIIEGFTGEDTAD